MIAWGVTLAALSAVLAFVPLFDVLGYELAFALGIAAALAGAHLGAEAVWRARAGASASDGAAADARPVRAVAALWARATMRVWALAIAPLAIASLNALRVRNCDFVGGLAWFALLPLASAALGAAAGVACGLARAWRRRVVPTLLAVAIVGASFAVAAWRFYAGPAIFAYDPFGGYFPGTLYDEEVAIGAPLLWARAYHAAAALAVLFACALFLDGPRLALRWRASAGRARVTAGRARVALAFALAAAAAAALGAAHARLGFYYSAADVQRELGGARETAHFVLHYTPTGPFARDLELVVADHEFRWAELRALFGVAPSGKIHAYLFDSAAQKQKYMGASHTSIAKPWRREIYLQADAWPHPVLAHELAHVFAGAFGDPIFGASRHGLAFNVGLIEGVATAAAWSGAPLTPHEQVAVARALGVEPPLEAVLSMRFLGYGGAAAYATAGSFCKFLLERSGPLPLERVYRAGGSAAAWREVYGVPLATLKAEWRRFIDGIAVPEREREAARARLAHPSVFHRVCAHALALRRDAARHAAQSGDRVHALALFETVCADDPDDPQNLVDILDTVAAADAGTAARPPNAAADDDAVTRAANALLAHPKVTPAQRAHATLALADHALLAGDRDTARARYDAALALPLDEADARLATAKRIAAAEPPGPAADALTHFLLQPAAARDAAVDLYTLDRLVAAAPDRGLHHYLLARQLSQRARWDDAAREFARARELGLPDERFGREALRLGGLAAFRAGRVADARAAFEALRVNAPPGVLVEADEWLRRASFAPPPQLSGSVK
jgi:hypothetical protein